MSSRYNRLLLFGSALRRMPDPPNVSPPPEGPDAPTDLVATAVSPTQINLSWTDNSSNEEGFVINRADPPGTMVTDTFQVGPNVTSYEDADVQPGEQKFYTVNAFNPFGSSPVSNKVDATTPTVGTLFADFFAPTGNVVEEQQYNLRARVLNDDQTVHTGYVAGQWNFAITAGGAFASIGGTNNDVLTIDPDSAGNSMTIVASYVGSETLDPDNDSVVLDIVVAPSGWPENEPAGNTQVFFSNGSNLNFGAGWNPSNVWQDAQDGIDNTRIEVVSDPDSKYGTVIEKRGFVGDSSGWLQALNVANLTQFPEYYMRIVFMLSSNWDYHTGGEKLFYYGGPGQRRTKMHMAYTAGNSPQFDFHPGAAGGTYLGAPMGVAVFRANGVGAVTRGVYHTFELRHRLNSAFGNSDGFFRAWFNGVEIQNWTWLGHGELNPVVISNPAVQWIDSEWPSLTFAGGEFFMFWGGSGDTKQANDFFRLSELYISGRN